MPIHRFPTEIFDEKILKPACKAVIARHAPGRKLVHFSSTEKNQLDDLQDVLAKLSSVSDNSQPRKSKSLEKIKAAINNATELLTSIQSIPDLSLYSNRSTVFPLENALQSFIQEERLILRFFPGQKNVRPSRRKKQGRPVQLYEDFWRFILIEKIMSSCFLAKANKKGTPMASTAKRVSKDRAIKIAQYLLFDAGNPWRYSKSNRSEKTLAKSYERIRKIINLKLFSKQRQLSELEFKVGEFTFVPYSDDHLHLSPEDLSLLETLFIQTRLPF